MYASGDPEQQLAAIGDIGISQHWVITPSGTYPIRGSHWTVTDLSYSHEKVSTSGVVLCVIFIWICLLGLLFLLLRERKWGGYIQVTVQGRGFHHSTTLAVQGPDSLMMVSERVNYARSLAAVA